MIFFLVNAFNVKMYLDVLNVMIMGVLVVMMVAGHLNLVHVDVLQNLYFIYLLYDITTIDVCILNIILITKYSRIR